MVKKLNTQEFINKSIKIHGDVYDYSKVEYINTRTKIIIICNIHGEFLQRPNSHLQNSGCLKCSIEIRKNNLRSSTEEFIIKSHNIHKNKYDYSKVNYINNTTKIIIICNKHGDFLQTPAVHLSGYGCSICSNVKKMDKYTFIEKAYKIHGNLYNYSLVEYKNNITNIKIICKIHGEFYQTPSNHLRSRGCLNCSRNNLKLTLETFIKKANKLHKNKYNYSKVNYINYETKIIIICKIHGEFLQTPHSHLNGHNCNVCSGKMKLDTQLFIERASNLHYNLYDYSLVNYINCNSKIKIICKKHGIFTQIPLNHIHKKSGCPKCSNKGYSNQQIKWLEFIEKYYNIQIQHMGNSNQEYTIKKTKWKSDGYCKENNTIYEFHGSYWHGDPTIYSANYKNTVSNKTMGYLYKKTLEREQKIKDLGYNLEVMWESDWNKINKSIYILQKKIKK